MTEQGPVPVPEEMRGDPRLAGLTQVFDLTAGKYDLTVKVGPSFTSQREEAANQMVELMRVFPQAAPVIGDLLAQNLDWPGADKISERLAALVPPPAQGENPELEQAKQLLQRAMAEVESAKAEAEEAKKLNELKAAEVAIKKFEAETERLKVEAEIARHLASARTGYQPDQMGNNAPY